LFNLRRENALPVSMVLPSKRVALPAVLALLMLNVPSDMAMPMPSAAAETEVRAAAKCMQAKLVTCFMKYWMSGLLTAAQARLVTAAFRS
ncbi:MAG TPA: hypothetical protein DEQ47_17135, partial [Solibacterales bacterium]|nr:hypothetical protein [Bryobacterales bacterium]